MLSAADLDAVTAVARRLFTPGARAMTTVLLVVDQDRQILHILTNALTARGYHVLTAADGTSGLRVAARAWPEAVVLELDLPDLDATTVIAELRGRTRVPIIGLASRAHADDTVRALDAGADDVVAKPLWMPEFLARLRAVLRRALAAPPDTPDNRIIDTGAFTVDLAAQKVWREGTEVRLTPIEWALLDILVRHRGDLVTHQQLLTEVWGPAHRNDIHYLRGYVGKLRRKLEPQPTRPCHLITEPGRGLRFRVEAAATTAHRKPDRDARQP